MTRFGTGVWWKTETRESTIRHFLSIAVCLLSIGITSARAAAPELWKARELLKSANTRDVVKGMVLLREIDTPAAVSVIEKWVHKNLRGWDALGKEAERIDNEIGFNRARWNRLQSDWVRERLDASYREREALNRKLGRILDGMDAARATLASYSAPETVEALASRLKSEPVPMMRQLYFDAAGYAAREALVPTLLDLLGHRDGRMRALAAGALRRSLRTKARIAAVKALEKDRAWAVRNAAYRAMAHAPFEEAVPFLCAAAAREKGQVALNVDALLETLTSESFSGNPAAWPKWWEENRERILAGEFTRAAKLAESTGGDSVATFFSVPIPSLNLMYAIDLSSSMRVRMDMDSARRKNQFEEFSLSQDRRGFALAEFVSSLRGLPEEALFNVVVYSDEAERFSKRSQRATKRSVERAIKWVMEKKEGALTNLYGSLNQCFDRVLDRRSTSTSFLDLPDTIVFLTDGIPTFGLFSDSSQIVRMFEHWNAAPGVVVHCVGIGEDHDHDFLRAVAKSAGGYYLDLAGRAHRLESYRRGIPDNQRGTYLTLALIRFRKVLDEDDDDLLPELCHGIRWMADWCGSLVPQLMARLELVSPELREELFATLVAIGKPARLALERLLGSSDEALASAAGAALDLIGE